MTAEQLERLLGELLGRFRAKEIDPIRKRLDIVERDLALDRRLADFEQRLADIDSAKPPTSSARLLPYRGA